MITNRTVLVVCSILTMMHHFFYHLQIFGPSLRNSVINVNYIIGLVASALIIIFYVGTTKWRLELKGRLILWLFDIMILWIFFNIIRSAVDLRGWSEWKEFLIMPYLGISLIPTLFFIIGLNIKYFSLVNKMLVSYCVVVWIISFFFMSYKELPIFLLMPVFYLIITFPLQSNRYKIITLIISLVLIIFSWTNRTGVLRILVSYLIVVVYYVYIKINLNRKIINLLLVIILIAPFYFIYLGSKERSVFEIVLGDSSYDGFSQEDMRADTRTFLYTEVFHDLKRNRAFLLGKGINAGYNSYAFNNLNRNIVEVGFLQLLLKMGIVGVVFYISIIISGIYKAIGRSQSLFVKYLGLLLSSYVLFFFVENILAFNLLNFIIWIVVGMCHSDKLRSLSDQQIKELYMKDRILAENA